MGTPIVLLRNTFGRVFFGGGVAHSFKKAPCLSSFQQCSDAHPHTLEARVWGIYQATHDWLLKDLQPLAHLCCALIKTCLKCTQMECFDFENIFRIKLMDFELKKGIAFYVPTMYYVNYIDKYLKQLSQTWYTDIDLFV